MQPDALKKRGGVTIPYTIICWQDTKQVISSTVKYGEGEGHDATGAYKRWNLSECGDREKYPRRILIQLIITAGYYHLLSNDLLSLKFRVLYSNIFKPYSNPIM